MSSVKALESVWSTRVVSAFTLSEAALSGSLLEEAEQEDELTFGSDATSISSGPFNVIFRA